MHRAEDLDFIELEVVRFRHIELDDDWEMRWGVVWCRHTGSPLKYELKSQSEAVSRSQSCVLNTQNDPGTEYHIIEVRQDRRVRKKRHRIRNAVR